MDRDLIGAVDDMIIGKNDARRIDEEARAEAGARPLVRIGHTAELVEEAAELLGHLCIVGQLAGPLGLHSLDARLDADDGGEHALDDFPIAGQFLQGRRARAAVHQGTAHAVAAGAGEGQAQAGSKKDAFHCSGVLFLMDDGSGEFPHAAEQPDQASRQQEQSQMVGRLLFHSVQQVVREMFPVRQDGLDKLVPGHLVEVVQLEFSQVRNHDHSPEGSFEMR